MKHAKWTLRLLTLFLCALMLAPQICGVGNERSAADAASPDAETVRVGLSVPELGTAVFLASAVSESGFSVGTYDGTSFTSLFSTSSTSLALFPDRNVQVNFKEDGTASGCALDNGNFGSYSIRTGKLYNDYQSARNAADRINDGFVAFVEGGFEVRYGAFATESEAQNAVKTAGHSVSSPVTGGFVVADCNTGKRLLEYERSDMLALRAKNGGEVSLNTRSGRKSYLGYFAFCAPSYMKVINVLDLELYVKCVMANEIGTNVSVETRRVFSVLIRTVPMNRKHDKYGLDVCNTECCQVYLGTFRRDAENDAIVDSTKGEYITYEGAPINCLYHSSNGGASCSSVAAWGGTEIPYLTSVTLGSNDSPSEVWQYTFSKDELYEFLSDSDVFSELAGGITDISIDATDPYGSGYVTTLSVTDKYNSTVTVQTSEEIRKALRFESANFTVSYSMETTILTSDGVKENADVQGYIDANGVYHTFDSFEEHEIAGADSSAGANRIVFDGVGTGHGVGLSSFGSEQLVSEGYSYRYIIAFYFQGTEISKV